MSTVSKVLGVLFGIMVIFHALNLIGVISGWTAAVFIIAGVSLIVNEFIHE